jgi:V8-like Glu-specific endopeptidase
MQPRQGREAKAAGIGGEMKLVLRPAAVIFTIALIAIGMQAPAMAIYDGDAITKAPPWAAYVTTVSKFLLSQTEESSCTGSIVADGWVLTAAHCVVEEKGGRLTKLNVSKFRVVLGRSDLTNKTQGRQYTVDDVEVYTGSDPGHLAGDYALLHLVGSLPADAMPLPLAPPSFTISDGAPMTAFGYGNTSETYGKDPDNFKGKASTVFRSTKAGSYVYSASCSTQSAWCMHRVGASEVLHGDSGGPWVTDTQNPFIIGVSSSIAGFERTSSTTGFFQYAAVAKSTISGVYQWIVHTASVFPGIEGTIYRNPDTAESWLVTSDGFRHDIKTGGDYLCFTAQGHKVVNRNAFELAEIPRSATPAICSTDSKGTKILLYGDGDFSEDTTGFANLEDALTSNGYQVTTLAGQTELPADLTPYGQIWHYGIDVPSSADQQALISFAKAGGSIFLTGERPCCESENQADSNIINSLVVTVGGITVGGLGDVGSCSDVASVNTGVIDSVAARPNALTTWKPVCPGGMANVNPNNVFASGSDGTPVGAVWDDNDVIGGGRLAILMDVNWAQNTFRDSTTMPKVTQNLAFFLSRQS